MQRKTRSAEREKPLMEMDDLERARAWDDIFESNDEGLLGEARDGKANVLVAAAVLTLPDGKKRISCAGVEAGDGEGMAPVSHLVVRAKTNLAPKEAIALEMIDVALSQDGTLCPTARRERARAKKSLDDIFDTEWVLKSLNRARGAPEDVLLSVAVLTLPTRERRVVFPDCEGGDGEARRDVANSLRRIRRLKLLRDGEHLERVLVRLTRSDAGWVATVRPDPIRGQSA